METNLQVTNQIQDPFAAADSAMPMARSYYGQLQLDIWFCGLEKGKGKVSYDPTVHKQRATAVNISLIPLPEQNITFEVRRELIAESHEWAAITWASLKALGVASTREANNRWVKMTQVPSGRKYRNGAGEERELTTFKFIALYPDEAACRTAYLADTGKSTDAIPSQVAQPPLAAANSDEARLNLEKAVPFIKAFAKMNGFDLDKTRAICKTQELIKKAIDVESPEFANVVLEAATAASNTH